MTVSPVPPHPDQLERVDHLLGHFEQLEAQLDQVREGLTHSHRLATLGTIASIIAHEYNNILTPMISYAQLAQAKPDDVDLQRKAIERSLSGALRASKISSSLLGFAREADEQHAAMLPAVIDEAVGCMARDPQKDGITLHVDVPEIQVAMSPLNLQQVLLNLMLNARKAMLRGGGDLSITGTVKGALVYIHIADTGPGIPDEIHDRLFEPFVTHKLDTASNSHERKGTGLGLCVCRELVHAAGGTITFETEPSKGTIFHITIPLADDLFETT